MFPNGRVKASGLVLLLVSSLFISLAALAPALAAPWEAPAGPILDPKWIGYVAGGGESLLIADIDLAAGMEVIHASGPVQPSSSPGRVTVLNGNNGYQLRNTTIYGLGDTAQIQMADVDQDGLLEIIVPLQHPAGLYILNAEDLSTLWRPEGTNSYGRVGFFQNPSGGRQDCSPVVGDVDGNGYPDIFVGIMAYLEYPQTGSLRRLEYDPGEDTIVERAIYTVWHPCAGGLSLGDTDNDGIFELYMCDRHVYFGGDGSWGRGLWSFWATDLTPRWRVYDWSMSSNIPMLADVNKDGIQDVVAANLGEGVIVANSTDGRPLQGYEGVVLRDQNTNPGIPTHYQSSVYDIDGDGNLELLSADGEHGGTPDYMSVWDLYTWSMDAMIDTGVQWKGPTIGEVTGDGIMDIVAVNYTGVLVYTVLGGVYTKVDEYVMDVGSSRAIDAVVQDTDGDGLNEIVVLTQIGRIYAFDTPGIAADPRARTELQFYSESRLGVSEFVPYERPWPDVIAPSPSPGAVGVSTGLGSLAFTLNHPLGERMDYVVTSDPDIVLGSGSGSNVGNGLKNVPVDGPLAEATTYHWQVNVTDESGHTTSKDYWFTTEPYIANTAPTQTEPSLMGGTLLQDLTAFNQSTSDVDGDVVTNVYNWERNGVSLANLNFPFDTRTDPDDEYSGFAETPDYSGYGHVGEVCGATSVPDGVVGRAYAFDGNDFIRVEEVGNRLDGGGAWTELSVEVWVRATSTTSTERLLWKPSRYESDVSYRLDYRNRDYRLEFTWYVYTASETYSVGPYYVTSDVYDWHHIAATYQSGVGLRLYVDGVEVAQELGGAITGTVVDTDGPLQIAWRSGSDFAGLLDELRIYPVAISPFMVTQRYLETKDGWSNSSTVSRYETEVGDEWRCLVTPTDGWTDGATLSTVTRTVIDANNTAPVAGNLTITPAAPLTGDDLVASYDYYDAEGHPEYGSVISWFRGSTPVTTGPVLPASFTAKGEAWTFTVTPSDGFDVGAPVTSDPVTIGNTPPSFTAVTVTPDPAFDDDTLTANSYGWIDADGDAEAYLYQWHKLVSGFWHDIVGATAQTLPPASFAAGDWLRVNVTALDGVDYGNWLTATRYIVDSDAPTHDPPVLVSGHGGNRTDEDLIVTAQNTSDPDGDGVTTVYNWLVDGQSYTSLVMPFETNSSLTALDYSGYGNDGAVYGATCTSAGLVGNAYAFDGDDYLVIPDDPSLVGTGSQTALTVEVWVKLTANQRGTRIVAKGEGTGSYMLGFQTSSGDPYNTVFFGIDNGAWEDVWDTSTTVLDVNVWYHVVGTYSEGVGLTIYINGTARVNRPLIGAINPKTGDQPLYISQDGTLASNRYLTGLLDEVHIYPTALSAAQVFQRYLDTRTGVSDHATIAAPETQAGEVWRCAATPNDGWQNGPTLLSNPVTIVSVGGNRYPRIDWYSPADTALVVDAGDGVNFTHHSSDPDGDPLNYAWLLNGSEVATTQNWTHLFGEAGAYNVTLVVDDGALSDSQQWTVTVVGVVQYTLTIAVVGNGTTVPAAGSHVYDAGTLVNLTASADLGWVFSNWTGDLTSVNAMESLLVDGNKTVTATFVRAEYTLTIHVAGNGSVSLNHTGPYYYGDVVELTAIADAGWTFFEWTGDLTGSDNPATLIMDGDKAVNATFSEAPPGGEGYLVVRGTDDAVWYRFYDGSDWSSWGGLGGLTSDTPAAAVLDGRLYVVVNGTDGGLWWGSVNLTDTSFSGWEGMSGHGVPTLTSNGTEQ
jgi:hypothetical protein